jgi:hypothetical protein
MKTYFIAEDGVEVGPFTVLQMRSMWAAGRLHAATQVRDSDDEKWHPAGVWAATLEAAPVNTGFGDSCGVLGLLAGLAFAGFGVMIFLGKMNAINEVAAAVYLVGGAILTVVSALTVALLSRR